MAATLGFCAHIVDEDPKQTPSYQILCNCGGYAWDVMSQKYIQRIQTTVMFWYVIPEICSM